MYFCSPASKDSIALSDRFHAESQQSKLNTITLFPVICGLALALYRPNNVHQLQFQKAGRL